VKVNQATKDKGKQRFAFLKKKGLISQDNAGPTSTIHVSFTPFFSRRSPHGSVIGREKAIFRVLPLSFACLWCRGEALTSASKKRTNCMHQAELHPITSRNLPIQEVSFMNASPCCHSYMIRLDSNTERFWLNIGEGDGS
jgi:hypothetical protein